MYIEWFGFVLYIQERLFCSAQSIYGSVCLSFTWGKCVKIWAPIGLQYILAVSIEIEYWEVLCCFSLVVSFSVAGAGSIVKRLCWCVSRSAVLSILGVVITIALHYVWDATVR